MEPDPTFDYMLDQTAGPSAGREELEAIVARSGRRRTRVMAAGMAVTLAVGAAAGWAVRAGRSPGGSAVAAGSATATTVAPPSAVAAGGSSTAAAPFLPGQMTLTKKFVRTTADGVTVRGYQQELVAGTVKGTCVLTPGFMAEVSTPDVVGQSPGGFARAASGPILSVTASAVGRLEAAPVAVVTTRTDASVAQVRVDFGDGSTDQMAPVDGWSVLAHLAPNLAKAPPVTGTAQALDASGKVIATEALVTPTVPPKGVPAPPIPPPANGGKVKGTAGQSAGSPNPAKPAPGACVVPRLPAPLPPAPLPSPAGEIIPSGGTVSPAICGC